MEHSVIFSGIKNRTEWRGHQVSCSDAFKKYLKEKVKSHLDDAEYVNEFESDLSNLAATDMATETLREILSAAPINDEQSDIAESIAACLLKEHHAVIWPWNKGRDKLNPNASLHGVDLVGFKQENTSSFILVLGEVKKSEQEQSAPSVMYGGDGLIGQLETLATDNTIKYMFLKWLHSRCKNTPNENAYNSAVTRYLKSKGRDFLLFGFLMRDTEPNESDVKSRAESLSPSVLSPCKAEVNAWYFPIKIPTWASSMREDDS